MPKLVWRVKLVAELRPGVVTETDVACIERPAEAGLAELGLRLDEAKRLTAALQAEMVPTQVAELGERRRACEACGRRLAGKVIHADGAQHRFAFARTGPAVTAEAFRQALAAAGVGADTPATVLCDGDAGLWRLQRKVLPNATVVLDWWHAAVRFEHALQAARGLGRDAADARLSGTAVRGLERAKCRLWHGRWPGCRRRLAALCRWTECRTVREVAGIDRLRQRTANLLSYLEHNEAALVHYDARRQRGEPIATSFVESAVDEIIAWRMAKAQQMRWSRATVPPFLDVRTAVLNDSLEGAFRRRHPGFRPTNNDQALPATA